VAVAAALPEDTTARQKDSMTGEMRYLEEDILRLISRLRPEERCTTRTPVVGDTVFNSYGQVTAAAGWKLAAGEVAIVEEVDGDGDFRLRNPSGQVSCVQLREVYCYVQQEQPVVALTRAAKTAATHPSTPNAGDMRYLPREEDISRFVAQREE
jgi:hypothetical protein